MLNALVHSYITLFFALIFYLGVRLDDVSALCRISERIIFANERLYTLLV